MKTIKGPNGLTVELDTTQIFPDDPGQGTPVLIVKKVNGHEFTASWNCGTCEGELDGYTLNQTEKDWLDLISPKVEKWMKDNGV